MSEDVNIVGMSVEEAKKLILLDSVVFIPDGYFVTMDFVPTRTRIWYDGKTNIVTKVTNG